MTGDLILLLRTTWLVVQHDPMTYWIIFSTDVHSPYPRSDHHEFAGRTVKDGLRHRVGSFFTRCARSSPPAGRAGERLRDLQPAGRIGAVGAHVKFTQRPALGDEEAEVLGDRKSTRLNSSHHS